jgi:DNA-binding response OmpR family regulator
MPEPTMISNVPGAGSHPLFPPVLSNRRAILVIDDDLGTRETFTWVLTAYGFRVTTASSGARGVTVGRSGHFDLMLVDLRLPDISGIEVVRSLQSDGSDVRFVLVSAFMTGPIADEARRLGASSVLEKPLTVEHLMRHVRAALDEMPG